MILRRFIQHVRDQNWTAVGLDFAVVVAGVFLGFQLSSWNAARIDAAREQEFILRLTDDFELIETRLLASIQTFESNLDSIDRISRTLEMGEAPSEEAGRTAFAEALQDSVTNRVPARPAATYVEMQSAGELGLLRDNALKTALIEYDQQSEISAEGWRLLMDRQLAYLGPIYDSVRFATVPDAVEGTESFEVKSYDFEKMLNDPDLPVALSAQLQVQANNLTLQRVQLEKTRRVLTLLREDRRQ